LLEKKDEILPYVSQTPSKFIRHLTDNSFFRKFDE